MAGYGILLFHFPDLPEQALVHAVKGRGILLLPGGHVTSHDPPPEAIHHLAVAHCVVGRVLTMQGKYPYRILNVLYFLSHGNLSFVTRPLPRFYLAVTERNSCFTY